MAPDRPREIPLQAAAGPDETVPAGTGTPPPEAKQESRAPRIAVEDKGPLSLDGMLIAALSWMAAYQLVAGAHRAIPYRDLTRPEVYPNLPGWLPVPPLENPLLGSLVQDPILRLLATVAVLCGLGVLAVDLMVRNSRCRTWLKNGFLVMSVGAAILVPTMLDVGLAQWHGRPWHGHDGGVLQTEQATDILLQGKNPYVEDYLESPQAEQSRRSGFWRRRGGNPALYHLPYLPVCFLLPIPLRPLARAIFGFYDPRMLYLAAYFGVLACLAALGGSHRRALVAVTALNPLMAPYLVQGRNDVLVLLPLAGMALCLQRGRRAGAFFLWGIACSTKQFAWLFGPFLLFYLVGPWPVTPRRVRDGAKLCLWAMVPIFLLVGPFLIWDFGAFWEDTVLFMSGSGEHPYPFGGTPGLGFANLLLYLGLVERLDQPYSFAFWQLLFAGPVLLAGALALLKRPDWRVVGGFGALFCGMFVFSSRVLHANYLGLLLPLVCLTAVVRQRQKGVGIG